MRAAGLAGVGGAVALASLVVLPVALATAPETPANATVAAKSSPPKPPPPKTTAPSTPPKTVTVTPSAPKSSAPPAQPAANCQLQRAGSAASDIKTEPWGQQRLGFTAVWSLTKGQGVTVAVVDSGVDTGHPQLRDHLSDYDVTGTGTRDCVGHGTEVAGIIGASDLRQQQVPFVGVAPAARIISVKMANEESNNNPRFVADAIRKAADLGAKVINVSSQTPDYGFLKDAVKYAQGKDAVLVAAAGNVQNQQKGTTEPAYPANYPGVISVGAVGPDGQLSDFSNTLTQVTLTAPGKDIVSTYPGGTYTSNSGTSFSTPFVAGVVALVRSYHPNLSADQVVHRMEVTAEGGTAKGTGYGFVDPMQAVTAVLPEENGTPASPPMRHVAIAQRTPEDRITRNVALGIAGGTLAVAAAVAAAGAIIPVGRRRGWRPGGAE